MRGTRTPIFAFCSLFIKPVGSSAGGFDPNPCALVYHAPFGDEADGLRDQAALQGLHPRVRWEAGALSTLVPSESTDPIKRDFQNLSCFCDTKNSNNVKPKGVQANKLKKLEM